MENNNERILDKTITPDENYVAKWIGAASYKRWKKIITFVDLWIKSYNEERPHSGKHCDGKTPMETFLQTKHLAQEKMLGCDLAA